MSGAWVGMAPPFELAASGSFGVLAGLLSGFLGIGGGAVLPPLFVFFLGLDQHRAQGISLAALLPPVGLPAVMAYRRAGVRVDPRMVLLLVVGFVLGALGGAWVAHRVPAHALRLCFATFLLFSAWRALRRAASDGHEPPASSSTLHAAVPIGITAGLMSGLLGVGGGLVALPLLRRFGKLRRLEAQATTLAMLLPPIGLPAVYVYAREEGGLPWELLVGVGVGFAFGAGLGARLAGRVNAKLAIRFYGAFLLVMAVVLVVRG